MIAQMSAVLQRGGEIIIAELMATDKHKIHTGCKKPLMTAEEMKQLMETAGFGFAGMVTNPIPVKKMRNPYCLYRFIKR